MIPILLSVLLKIFASFFGVILIATLWWYIWYFGYMKYLKDFPQVPYIVPFLGHGLQVSTTIDLYNKVKLFHAKLGAVFVIFFGLQPHLVVADANLVQVILTSQKHIDKSPTYKFLERYLGQGLVTASGERWRSQRKLISPAFHVTALQQFVGIFDSTSDELVKKLGKEIGKEFTDIHDFIVLSSFDAVCKTMMGTSLNSHENEISSFFNNMNELEKIVIDRTMSVMEHYDCTYLFSKNCRKEKGVLKTFHAYTDSIIAKRRETLSSKPEENARRDIGLKTNTSLLDLLLQYEKNDSTLANEEIRNEIHTFLAAGSETTATAVTFAMYLLAKHQDIQVNIPTEEYTNKYVKLHDRVVEELKDLLGDDKDRKISYQDVHGMKYLELVIKETLRMYPSAPIFARQLHEDLIYGDTVIPKGVTVAIMPMLLHMDEKYFPNPGKFDPERFLPENSEGRHAYSYVPFSMGPRNCIGQKYAMLAIKSTLTKILRNFELFPVKHNMVLAMETVLKSTNGVKLQIKSRKW